MGGHLDNPSYQDVSNGSSGHLEAVKIVYDSTKISYEDLLNVFWRQVDPSDAKGQFVDRGLQYRTAIFYSNQREKDIAEDSKLRMEKSQRFKKNIVTEIIKVSHFYNAEEYHQDYYKKHPAKYKLYRSYSGRDRFLDSVWKDEGKMEKKEKDISRKKKSKDVLRTELTPLQFKVTQEDGTEPSFRNEF